MLCKSVVDCFVERRVWIAFAGAFSRRDERVHGGFETRRRQSVRRRDEEADGVLQGVESGVCGGRDGHD